MCVFIHEQTPALMPFPDLTAPELAYPGYVQQDINPKQVTKVSGVYLKNMDMPELVEKVCLTISMKHKCTEPTPSPLCLQGKSTSPQLSSLMHPGGGHTWRGKR
jgi:hypothetical protein